MLGFVTVSGHVGAALVCMATMRHGRLQKTVTASMETTRRKARASDEEI
jgi:hypothetical protein